MKGILSNTVESMTGIFLPTLGTGQLNFSGTATANTGKNLGNKIRHMIAALTQGTT